MPIVRCGRRPVSGGTMPGQGFFARIRTLAAATGLAGVVVLSQSGAALAAGPGDWPQYMHGPRHTSMSPAAAFTPSNAASASLAWHWQPPAIPGEPTPLLDASPTVAGGRVYIGAQSGGFYALDEATGAVVWNRQLDTEQAVDCTGPGTRLGITSTAAVLPDPVTGTSTVYVSGARYLYALDAATGTVAWQTEIGPPTDPSEPNAYYNWSSPTVVGGHIYVGLSSNCDKPLIRGGVVELDQHTGQVLHTWYTVPAGSIGGSVWSSVAASSNGGNLWVTTGNECSAPLETCPAGNQVGHSLSIVHLSSTLSLRQAWQVPGGVGHNFDFGASPTLFGSSTSLEVGACNKNGNYYALAANPLGSSPLWADAIGARQSSTGTCLASAVWNGRAGALYVAGDGTTIGGTSYSGSIRQVNPQTGAYIWETGMPCAVTGTPTLDSAGVLAVGTFGGCATGSQPGAYLVDASTGAILTALPVGSGRVFGQPVFAQKSLFVATETKGLYAFAP